MKRSLKQFFVGAAASSNVVRLNLEMEQALRYGGETHSGTGVNPDTAMRQATVFACVRIIAGTIANMPLHVISEGDRQKKKATDHFLWPLLHRRPNRWQTSAEFRRMMSANVLLKGNGYALVVRSRGKIIELIPILPDNIEVKQLDDYSLQYTFRRKTGESVVIPASEIFHLRNLSTDGVLGLSTIAHAREAIGLSMQSEKAGAKLFKNGAIVGATYEHPARLSAEAYDRLKKSVDEANAGAGNAYKTLILEEGMQWKVPQLSAEDMQFIESRKFQRSDIAMFFGVPPHMIGDTEKSTSWGSGIVEQKEGFLTFTLEDHLTTWEQAITRDLVPEAEADKIFARFNRASLLRANIEARYRAHAIGRQWGWLSVNDVREFEDMNAVEDGGDEYLVPLNMIPLGEPRPDAAADSLAGEARDKLERKANDASRAA